MTGGERAEVRPAAAGDVAGCARLAALWSGGEPPDWHERLEHDLDDPERTLVCAVAGEHVVGYGRAGRFTHPPVAEPDVAPEGWYLVGLVVDPAWRRQGVGRVLCEARLAWVAERGECAWCFTNAANLPSIALHRSLGFREVTRRFSYPGVRFEGGEGVLMRCDLR